RLSKQAEGPDLDSAAPEESWKQIAALLGMPVEFDAPEEQRRPRATWLLSAAIICASLIAFSNLREIVQRFGLIPAEATRLGGLTLVTSLDRKSTRLNSSHLGISYAVFCLKKKTT